MCVILLSFSSFFLCDFFVSVDSLYNQSRLWLLLWGIIFQRTPFISLPYYFMSTTKLIYTKIRKKRGGTVHSTAGNVSFICFFFLLFLSTMCVEKYRVTRCREDIIYKNRLTVLI